MGGRFRRQRGLLLSGTVACVGGWYTVGILPMAFLLKLPAGVVDDRPEDVGRERNTGRYILLCICRTSVVWVFSCGKCGCARRNVTLLKKNPYRSHCCFTSCLHVSWSLLVRPLWCSRSLPSCCFVASILQQHCLTPTPRAVEAVNVRSSHRRCAHGRRRDQIYGT